MPNFKRIYICSPLNADTEEVIRENVAKARLYMEVIGKIFGCKAVAPHAYLTEMLDDRIPAERQMAIEFGLKYLTTCDALAQIGNTVTSGMQAEIELAKQIKIPVIEADIACVDLSAIIKGADRFAR